jgi:hypothetical protein
LLAWRIATGHAKGSQVIIVVVHVGAVKIYVHSSSSGGAQEKGKMGVKTG